MTVNVWRFFSYRPTTQLSRYRLGVLYLRPLLALTTPAEGEGQLRDTSPTWDPSDKAQVVTCASDGRAVHLVAPMAPSLLRFNNLLGWDSWNPGKHCLYYPYRSVPKETPRESPTGRGAWGRRGGSELRSPLWPGPPPPPRPAPRVYIPRTEYIYLPQFYIEFWVCGK